MTLDSFLAQKPLFYNEIDYDRFPKAVDSIRDSLKLPKIIHLVGTNGKGSTGRFLATALHRAGFKTGHYTSPHILRFNERVWLEGSDISDEALEAAHRKLSGMLEESVSRSLSYFEYTTLLALIAYEECDYVVFEAGLGGEHDATNAFDKVLSVFTPIDFDHAAFLGETIDAIAATKLRSMQHTALLGKQKHPETVRIAREIAAEKGCRLLFAEEMTTPVMAEAASYIAKKHALSDYLRDNLELSMCAFALLGLEVSEALFDQEALFGRLSRIRDNVTLDVGHNPLAAAAIARAYEGKKVTLVYNTYADKDYRTILGILSPIVESVEIIDVAEGRIAERADLENALADLHLPSRPFERTVGDKEYLVFGSFSVAEAFLKRMT